MRGSDLFETLLQIKAYGRRIFRVGGQPDRRTGMIAAAGHDLRTPMTRMRLRAEFIEDEAEREKWLADLAELAAGRHPAQPSPARINPAPQRRRSGTSA